MDELLRSVANIINFFDIYELSEVYLVNKGYYDKSIELYSEGL